MSVRSIQARVECDPGTFDCLWRTHRVFNERLPDVLSVLFKMRRGEWGDRPEVCAAMQAFSRCLLRCSSQTFVDALNKAARADTRSDASARKKLLKQARDEEEAKACTAAFDMFKGGVRPLEHVWGALAAELPRHMREKIIEGAAEHIRSHEELTKKWQSGHDEWLRQRAAWEADTENEKYLALRPRFEAFEQDAGGPAGKRRGRWHLYLKWLSDNPDLAAWRGQPAGVTPLDAQAKERVQRAKPRRQRTVEAEEFWKVNPELAALDRLHGDYERKFIRRRKRKKNPDNFDHRPTFTLPDPLRHPRYFVFKASKGKDEGYENLLLPPKPGQTGRADLRILVGDNKDGTYPCGLVRVCFRGDPRLSDFTPAKITSTYRQGAKKGQTKTKDAYKFFDRHLNVRREADISGIRLVFRMNRDKRTPRAAYLYLTCTVRDRPLSESAKAIRWSETDEVTKKGKKRKQRTLPDGLVVCAVDLGIRNLGFATIARYEDGKPVILRSRNIWLSREERGPRHAGRLSKGPGLAHIAKHKREIQNLRRQRGKPVKGEDSHVTLQKHITHMGEDRFRKGARAIVSFALNVGETPADVILLEILGGLIPDAERERGVNRSLVAWNRARLVERVKEMGKDAGLRVHMVSPFGTSQVCSRCGKLGRRYSVVPNGMTGRPELRFGHVEKLFACTCGYRANADHNASVNLHRRFVLGDAAVKAYNHWHKQSRPGKARLVSDVEKALLDDLLRMHGLSATTL